MAQQQVVSIIRDEIVQDEQFARSAVINQPIGQNWLYITCLNFMQILKGQMATVVPEMLPKKSSNLKKENVQGIILDLRNNGGGSLPEVVNMVGLFIKRARLFR